MSQWPDTLLSGRRILCAGASSGIGRACAVLCSQVGARVIVMGRDQIRIQETLGLLSGAGHESIAYDLGDPDGLADTLGALEGRIDGMIYSAGVERTRPLRGLDWREFETMLRVNAVASAELARLLTKPGRIGAQGSSFVLIASVSGITADRGKLEYSGSKALLISMARSMANELAPKKVRVNCVSPAMVQTPMLERMFTEIPEESVKEISGRHAFGLLDPVDVANGCVFLLSDLSARITGQNLVIDSGFGFSR
jgi:NAD(P)-dependent dehydrogenase (short-subunit alcohol dehydrogenase family)